jgi:hypothetical protein
MAFVAADTWQCGLTITDNNGNKGSFAFNMPGALTAVAVQNALTTLATSVQLIIDGAITSVNFSKVVFNDAPPATLASSEVERKLRIPLGTVKFEPGVTSVEIPSPLFTLEQPGTDVVVPAVGSPLADVVLFLTSGLVTPGNGPVTYYGEDLTRVGTMVIKHRGRAVRK